MTNRLISVGDDFTLPAQAKVTDANLPAATNAAAVGGKVGKGSLFINPADYGVLADGATNDAAKFITAAAAAASLGIPLSLPAAKTIGLGSLVTLPAGLTMLTNGATFAGLTENGDFLLTINSDTRIIGELKVSRPVGTNVRGVNITGSRVTIDAVRVEAPAPGAGVGDTYDCGLTVTGAADRITIGALTIKNFDYAAKFDTCSRISLGVVDITSYVRGVYINDATDLTIQYGLMRTASPNAAINPGHNGILMEATAHDSTADIHFNNVTVKDAGEHGYRLGGSKRIKRAWFNTCTSVNSGGSGFKVLGGTSTDNNYHEDLFFNDCIVEDAGQTPQNACGFQVEFARRVKITNPVVRKKLKTYSAGQGVQIQAGDDVLTVNPSVNDTLISCYEVSYVLGDCTNVRLNGGQMASATGDGIKIDHTNRTFRRVSVEGYPMLGISGAGYNLNIANAGGGTTVGGSWITWQSTQPAALQINPASVLIGWLCDVKAAWTSGGFGFKNGSTWVDNSTGIHYRKNNGWFMQNQLGTTAGRPSIAPAVGQEYYDTTLNKPVWLKSTGPNVWIDATGATV